MDDKGEDTGDDDDGDNDDGSDESGNDDDDGDDGGGHSNDDDVECDSDRDGDLRRSIWKQNQKQGIHMKQLYGYNSGV